MSNFSFDVALLLQDNLFGTIGTDIFISEDVPTQPDEMIMIRNFGSALPDLPSINYSYPIAVIITRFPKGYYQECETKAYAIKDFMKTVDNYYINNSRFISIYHQSGPRELGIDLKLRPMFSSNFLCHRTAGI